MLGAKTNGGATGPMMMLKAFGLDPEEIGRNIESAKITAAQVMKHFDERLLAIEAGQAGLAERVAKVAELLAELVAIGKERL